MTTEAKKYIYSAEEIFEDIPDDPNNVNMKIPDEVAQQVGLEPGDKVKILWGDQGTVIIQKAEEEEKDG